MFKIINHFSIGWGLNDTETRSKATWLQKAEIEEVPLNVCNGYYKKDKDSTYQYILPKGLIQSQMCAKGRNEKNQIVDSCQGFYSQLHSFLSEYKLNDYF